MSPSLNYPWGSLDFIGQTEDAMKDFILHPYEYAGASFNPKAHAEARLEVGGKKRNFALKLHEGVIYFKEPARAQVFAIPELYQENLVRDSIGLISRWQQEVATGNYGAFIAKRDFFAGLPVRGNFLLLLRTNGHGWMREHFDEGWFDLPDWEKPRTFDLWNDKTLDVQIGEILPIVKASLLQRVVEPEIRQSEKPRWMGGSGTEFSTLVRAAARLFLPSGEVGGAEPLHLKFKSHSAFAKGDVEASWLKAACKTPGFNAVWQLLESEFHYIGVQWSEGGEKVEMYPRARVESVYLDGLDGWGENWRGNWAPQRSSFMMQIPPIEGVSAAEKHEAELVLRRWLRGRMDTASVERLFQEVQI